MSTIKAQVSIKGIKPLLQHHFGPEALPLEKKPKRGVAGHDPEEWRDTLLVTKTGQLYVQPSYVFGSVKSGAKYTKQGRGSIQTLVAATLQVEESKILIDRYFPGFPNGKDFDSYEVNPPKQDDELPVYLDIRSVVNPSTRGRNIRYRVACSPGWKMTFTLVWEETVVNASQMEASVRDAGMLVGIASGRSIGMGRFEVESFEIVK